MRENSLEERKVQYVPVDEEVVILSNLRLESYKHVQDNPYGKLRREVYILTGKIIAKEKNLLEDRFIFGYHNKDKGELETNEDGTFRLAIDLPAKIKPWYFSLELVRTPFPNRCYLQFDKRLGVVFIDG